MGKRSKLLLLGIILLAFVALGTKPLWIGGEKKTETPQAVATQTEAGQTDTNNSNSEPSQAKASSTDTSQSLSAVKTKAPKLAKLLEDSFAKGKPVAVVYTYNADC
ncbi:hypothetical protein JCM39194_06720 [Desulfotomaculum varum]